MHTEFRCWVSKIARTLVWIGALNWGLIGVGFFFRANWNVINLLLPDSLLWLEMVIYILVGIAAVWMIVGCRCRNCKEECDKCRVRSVPSSSGPSM